MRIFGVIVGVICLNFTVVDGDRDYLNCKDEFVELYNGRSCTVPELIEKLGITINEYKLLRDECARENLVVLRQRGGNTRRKRNE